MTKRRRQGSIAKPSGLDLPAPAPSARAPDPLDVLRYPPGAATSTWWMARIARFETHRWPQLVQDFVPEDLRADTVAALKVEHQRRKATA